MIALPWPDMATLGPNARKHYRVVAKAKAEARESAYLMAGQLTWSLPKMDKPKLRLLLDFYPPDNRVRDWDNLSYCMKSPLDGIFEALGLDDSLIRQTVVSLHRAEPNNPRVEIQMEIMK